MIPEILFRMQHTWLGSRSSHNLKNGLPMDVNSDVVFTTYNANAKLQPAYRLQVMEDAGNLRCVIRQHFAAFQLSRKRV